MVGPLGLVAGTARVFSAGSILGFADSSTDTFETLQILHSQGASATFRKGKTTKKVVVAHGCFVGCRALHYRTARSLRFQFETRRARLRHKVYMVSENKEASTFDQSLVELARKTVNPFASSSEDSGVQSLNKTLNTGDNTERDLEESRQIGKDSGRVKKAGSQPKATRLVFELPKRRISLPGWKRNVWNNLGLVTRNFEATRLGPLPPFIGILIALLGFVFIIGKVVDKWVGRATRGAQMSNTSTLDIELSDQLVKAPTGIPIFLEKDLKKKESVEWVNMVLGKLWKIYRLGLESWLLGLLQPLIDNLQKPDYVKRVEITQFYLGDEPIGIRSVERRASRRVNDLQYHIGLRYSGGARMLLLLRLRVGFIPITVPVGVRGLDVDGELWVKLRLIPSEPWVGTATWAFVSLPKIKLDLSPFRLFNLMAIPFLSIFLRKLLTQDLPQLFVRPNKNVVDFMKGEAVGPLPKDFKGATLDGNKDFSGELSVTLVDARKLTIIPYGKSDPYVLLILGDQAIRSKKNSQTSVIGPPGMPIWNQDFRLLVVDPKTQRLAVRVRDNFGLTSFTIGYGEVELNALQDTVPSDRVVRLRGAWGPFQKRFSGEILLRLTYTAYVEEDDAYEHLDRPIPSPSEYGSDVDDHSSPWSTINKVVLKAADSVQGKESIPEMFSAVIAEFNEEAREESLLAETIAKETEHSGDPKAQKFLGIKAGADGRNGNTSMVQTDKSERLNGRNVLLWLGLVTGLALLVDISLNFSNLLNP